MEREILFRGRCCDSGSWHEGMPVRASEPPYSICAINIPEKRTCVQVDPGTIGQYTGLTDKNGRRIFEGDIVKRGDHKYVVMWSNNDCAMFGLPRAPFEVIGNIHDNPEMMKGETNV